MYIKQDMGFNDLMENCWSGAVDTLKTIEEHDKEEELMELLNNEFTGIPELTEINDILWFEDEFIFQCLGISESEDEEEEEEEIDIDFSFYNYKNFDSFCEDHRCEDCPLWHPKRDCEKEFERLRNT